MRHLRFAAFAVLAGIPLWACASSPVETSYSEPPPPENISAYATTPAALRGDLRGDFAREAQWTRLYATSAIAGLGDTDASLARLVQSEDAIAATIAPLLGSGAQSELGNLLHARVSAITSLVANYQTTSARSLGTRDALDGNAQAIARFWARVAPALSVRDLTPQLVAENDALVGALEARASRDDARAVALFDLTVSNALAFADTLTQGLARTRPSSFTPSTILPNEEHLRLELRSIASERVFWTRSYLVGRTAGSPVQSELDRAVQSSVDIGHLYASYYGDEAGSIIQFHAHQELVDSLAYWIALTSTDAATVDRIASEWDVHAASYADVLVARDPTLSRERLLRQLEVSAFRERSMIRAHVEQRWADDVASYDELLDSNDAFSDTLAHGVSLQFPLIL